MSSLLYVLIISIIPVIELRGAIPVGMGLGLPFWAVLVTALIGNMLPIPFLILFTRRVLNFLREKSAVLRRFVSSLEDKAASKEALLKRYQMLGLCLLVAIPLPGTGAWTGALVAALFDIRLKYALPVIALGVLIAGLIVSFVSYGVTIIF